MSSRRLEALTRQRAVIDVQTFEIYFLGPGDYTLEESMPAGTVKVQCEKSRSGHMILPCDAFSDAPAAGVRQQQRDFPVLPAYQ